MAQRRMFNKSVTDSDMFIEMASSAQALYFHLNQGADDDGFNNQVQNAMFKAHASTDDLKVLLAKNFLLRFENGVIVIKHWRLHNTLRKDRYTPTDFQAELNCLGLAKNGEYVIENNGRLPSGCQVVAKRLPQDRLGKDSIESMHACKERDITNQAQAQAYACEDYADVMKDMALEEEVKPILWSFIKHCQLNGKKVSNDKLINILFEMDRQRLSPQEKIETLQAAINGGYYDIKR